MKYINDKNDFYYVHEMYRLDYDKNGSIIIIFFFS